MAKSRPKKSASNKVLPKKKGSNFSPEVAQELLVQATTSLHSGQPEEALGTAKKLLSYLEDTKADSLVFLPALELTGEIYLELGLSDEARDTFTRAVSLDPEGQIPEELGGGADKFLWLAQLCEEGGSASVSWFDKGAAVLRREISRGENGSGRDDAAAALSAKRQTLANALCGAAEVYMTDLSWEEDAEARCDALVTEACIVAPDTAEPLQTLASVRISQSRMEDAQSALSRSLETWTELPADHPTVPDFSTRISLSRLLMEAGMEEKALDVISRLVREDDNSVEAWYLGGWCQYLLAAMPSKAHQQTVPKPSESGADAATDQKELLSCSRRWLKKCVELYEVLEYEDERLRDHAAELLSELTHHLGPQTDLDEAAEEVEDDTIWEDFEEGEELTSDS